MKYTNLHVVAKNMCSGIGSIQYQISSASGVRKHYV